MRDKDAYEEFILSLNVVDPLLVFDVTDAEMKLIDDLLIAEKPFSPNVLTALSLVSSRYGLHGNKLSVKEIGALLNVSPRTIAGYFGKITGNLRGEKYCHIFSLMFDPNFRAEAGSVSTIIKKAVGKMFMCKASDIEARIIELQKELDMASKMGKKYR